MSLRRMRFVLAGLLALAVLLDVQEAMLIYTDGWPPYMYPHFGGPEVFVTPVVTTRDRVVYGFVLLVVALAQGVLAMLEWKAWRRPITTPEDRDNANSSSE